MKRRVVITGMGVVTPIGLDHESFWEALINKRSGVSRITKFDPSRHSSQIAAEIKGFEPTKWISRKQVRRLDPFAQYAIAAGDMAVEHAGLDLDKENLDRCGVILGAGIGGISEMESQMAVYNQRGPSRVSPLFITKLMMNSIAGEISIRHGFRGPNFVTASACASSAHAVGIALKVIQNGLADVIITGGSESTITPMSVAGFCSLKALSRRNDEPEKASRPFDKDRDGFIMGEGAGILVIESLEHARKRRAAIHAEILGVGMTADAHHITEPAPNGVGATAVMKVAMADAGIGPEQVDYINAHGTSTPKNDTNETYAIKGALGERAYQVPVSATKSMTGHLIGASGAVELIGVVLSIQHQVVHPTANYETPDPECDLDYVPGDPREMPINIALSNSFGFGGHNACIAVGKFVD